MKRAIWTASGLALLMGVTSALFGGERGFFGPRPVRHTGAGEVTIPRHPVYAGREPAGRSPAQAASPAAIPAHHSIPQRPAYGGHAAFRPYNYRHVLPQTAVAGQWGLSPHQAYTHDYRQLRPHAVDPPPRVLEPAPAPPVAPRRDAVDTSRHVPTAEPSSPAARGGSEAPPRPRPVDAAPAAVTAESARPEFRHDYDAERRQRAEQWAMQQRADRSQYAPTPPPPLRLPATVPARLQPGTIEPAE